MTIKIELAVGEKKKKQRFGKEVENTVKGESVSTIDNFIGWNETLASSSEAIVKAEQSSDGIDDLKQMQEKTIETLHKKEEKKQFPFDI